MCWKHKCGSCNQTNLCYEKKNVRFLEYKRYEKKKVHFLEYKSYEKKKVRFLEYKIAGIVILYCRVFNLVLLFYVAVLYVSVHDYHAICENFTLQEWINFIL